MCITKEDDNLDSLQVHGNPCFSNGYSFMRNRGILRFGRRKPDVTFQRKVRKQVQGNDVSQNRFSASGNRLGSMAGHVTSTILTTHFHFRFISAFSLGYM